MSGNLFNAGGQHAIADPNSAAYAAQKAQQMTPGTVPGGQYGPGDTLGFGHNAASSYFEQNPTDAFQFYVNKLGGIGSTLGRYASARFGGVYADYLKQAAANPNLLWTDYLNKYAGGSQLTQQFLGTAPQLRGQQVAPWSQSRFLG